MASESSKPKKSTQRKLTAILCADVQGYSRLMGAGGGVRGRMIWLLFTCPSVRKCWH